MARQENPLLRKRGVETMLLAVDAENILEDIISSYEITIQSVEAFFETAHQIVTGLEDSIFDTRQKRERINDQLRDNLAKNESLRKKDFDSMVSIISSHQNQEEQEIRNLSTGYLNEQTNLIQELRRRLRSFADALGKGEAGRVKEFQAPIKEILAKQEKRGEEVISKLQEFRRGQEETARMLKNLLAKGRELRIKDLKLMLAEFKRQHQEPVACKEEKRQEIKNLPGEFRSRRAEAAQNRLAAHQKI